MLIKSFDEISETIWGATNSSLAEAPPTNRSHFPEDKVLAPQPSGDIGGLIAPMKRSSPMMHWCINPMQWTATTLVIVYDDVSHREKKYLIDVGRFPEIEVPLNHPKLNDFSLSIETSCKPMVLRIPHFRKPPWIKSQFKRWICRPRSITVGKALVRTVQVISIKGLKGSTQLRNACTNLH